MSTPTPNAGGARGRPSGGPQQEESSMRDQLTLIFLILTGAACGSVPGHRVDADTTTRTGGQAGGTMAGAGGSSGTVTGGGSGTGRVAATGGTGGIDGSRASGGAGGDAAAGTTTAAGGATGTGGDTGTGDAGRGGAGAGGIPTSCGDGGPIPADVPSTQTVTFTVRNDANVDRYLVTKGSNCLAFGVEQWTGTSWLALDLELSDSRFNACYPGSCDTVAPSPSELAVLHPGQSYALKWDARALVTCTAPGKCPQLTVSMGAPQPVPAGRYRLTARVFPALPLGCSSVADAGAVATCSLGMLGPCTDMVSTCEWGGLASASAEVTLGTQGGAHGTASLQ